MNNILTERIYMIPGGWHEPLKKLLDYPSVVHADYIDTCSSAGDWGGMLFQRIGNRHYAIPFMQENNYPIPGFTLYTGDVFARFSGKLSSEIEHDILEHFIKLYY